MRDPLGRKIVRRVFCIALGSLLPAVAVAQLPGEIAGVAFSDGTRLEWDSQLGYASYNVYRGALSELATAGAARCHGYDIATTAFVTPALPATGEGFYYLVVGRSASHGEGPPGIASAGGSRVLLGACEAVVRNHVLGRAGFGPDAWSADRLDALGVAAYLAEQLDPDSIDESTNIELNARLGPIDPPADIFQQLQQQTIRATYARRQLEQQVATFWANHFNTFWQKLADIFTGVFPPCVAPGDPPQCDELFPLEAYAVASALQYDEIESFRELGFNGSFRQMVEASGTGLAMIVYLDTYLSVAGAPNENYPRELMELHTMGVDGGYTQGDVEELSRVITGWTGCKKQLADAGDPLAPCIDQYWLDTPAGEWVAHFVPANHDCTEKTLFAGVPGLEITIPSTCGNPPAGANDLVLALDAIVAHPATAEFISRKILERFVSDEPEPALVDQLVAEWNDATNPAGVGDLRAVLTAALTSSAFLDPDRIGSKVKTPFEHLVSTLRATGAETDGLTGVLESLVSMGHIPHYNPVPTGWAEDGATWIGTNNTLDRQNFPFALLASPNPAFSADPIQQLADAGVSTGPGNADAIVDFFADVLFGGALTPVERQLAIDYLSTDSAGAPAPYDDVRILETVGLLLGYPHFQEQ